ncbi:MAG: hypothetical protein IPK16_30880 [Anaerolineales bacterium]|nr:hypothetical protein [Anaerolineales bacterium]
MTSAKLVQETDANGNSITYTPGEFGPTQISNGARTLTLAYQSPTPTR